MAARIIGERISELRVQSGLTQADLAERVHVSRSSVQAWECGSNDPSLDTLVCVAQIFHVTVDYLLGLSPGKTVVLDLLSERDRECFLGMISGFDKSGEKAP